MKSREKSPKGDGGHNQAHWKDLFKVIIFFYGGIRDEEDIGCHRWLRRRLESGGLCGSTIHRVE